MASSFFGLNVATQGLYTAQTSLDVTNHNISNAETEGYSKQYVVQRASRPLSNSTRGMIGTGSEIINIKQQRSTYIDNKFWNMNTDLGKYSVKSELLSQLELLFNEPSDSGYNAQLNDVFENLQSLSTNPAEDSMIANFIDSADSFTQYFNNLAEQLADYQRDANFGIKASIEKINFIGDQLASVNNQITNMELSGLQANDLRDERANLIDSLSKIVNVDTKEVTDINGKKNFLVSINGQVLVDGSAKNSLEIKSRTSLNNVEDEPDLYDIYWTSGKKLYLNNETASGELKGYMEIRDGNNGENFTGTVSSGAGTNTIVVQNLSKNDIPAGGTIYLDNQAVTYTGFTYNEATNEMTFTLASNAPAVVTTARIGEAVDSKGIPYYTQQLNEFVRTIAKAFNEIHRTGNAGTGSHMFTYEGYTGVGDLVEASDVSYNKITIDNFSFNQNIIEDNSLLLNTTTTGAGESANDIYIEMLNIKHDTTLFAKGEPDSYMQSLISELGIDSKRAESFYKGQDNLIQLIDQQRKSISSVDLNEETADMIRYQQAYNLSAKMISVMSEIYDVLINQIVSS